MEMNSYIYKSMINRVMHSDIFKAEEDWTKSQQNDWLLGYMKNDVSVSTQWRSNLEHVHC